MSPNPDTVEADRPLDECLIEMARDNRRWVPVLDDDHYFGLLALTDIAKVPRDQWSRRTARDVARTDVPSARSSETVANIARMIREHGGGAVAIIDDEHVAGVVTTRDIANIERLLDRLDTDP